MSYLSPESLLQEMFHTDYYEENEGDRMCPKCKIDFLEHRDLINHMKEEHPTFMHYYVDDLDKMLHNPFQYFSMAWYGGDKCTLCASVFHSKSEFNGHMKEKHKEDIEAFKKEFGEKR